MSLQFSDFSNASKTFPNTITNKQKSFCSNTNQCMLGMFRACLIHTEHENPEHNFHVPEHDCHVSKHD